MPSVSAFVPYYENEASVQSTIASISSQSVPILEVVVYDDGSTKPLDLPDGPNIVSVVRSETNLGRGAVRAYGMSSLHGDLVLSVDSTNVIPPDFLERAMKWFEDDNVAAVFGQISQAKTEELANRWRGRHLFKTTSLRNCSHRSSLACYGALLRRSAVLKVGNFNPKFSMAEDRELGERLLAAGYDVIFDPNLECRTVVSNTIAQVLERYWRWNYCGSIGLMTYLKLIAYSLKVMIPQDLKEGDVASALISFICPHYQLFRTLKYRLLTTTK